MERNQVNINQQQSEVAKKSQNRFQRGFIIPAKTSQRGYFVLDQSNGLIHMYKNIEDDIPIESLSLSGGVFLDKLRIVTDLQNGKALDSFEFKLGGVYSSQFTVMNEDNHTENLRQVFASCTKMLNQRNKLTQGALQDAQNVFNKPWNLRDFVVLSLEKIGDGYEASADSLRSSITRKQDDGEPQTVAEGLALGTKSMLSNIFSAVAGVVAEPLLGAQEGGLTGGAVGLGRGILGLVWSPVKGTIDLVTQTSKGLSNTPKTMYVGFNRMIKRVSKDELSSRNPNEPITKTFNPEDHVLLGEENGQLIYINKKRLREQINSSQVLSDLMYESEKFMNEDEQIKMRSVIMRQRDLLKRKEQKLQKEASKKDQIKTITEELLNKLNESNQQQQRPPQEDETSSVANEGSETSSVAEEREIHAKLQKILQIIQDKDTSQQKRDDIQISQDVLAEQSILMEQRFIQEIFDEAQGDDVQLYLIQASQLQGIVNQDEKWEFDNFYNELRRANRQGSYEEEKKFGKQVQQLSKQDEIVLRQKYERQQELLQRASKFKGFTQYKPGRDDYRHPEDAASNGGIHLKDTELIHRLRSSGKEMLKTIGKKIMSGSFNLTTVSFPIKCMCAKSTLESIGELAGINQIYINAAALSQDPIERMILAITSSIAYFYPTHMFEKPLNPILGETFQAEGQDGTKIYVEQTEHRPPVTNFLYEGPNSLYRMYGYSSFVAKAWINSISLKVDGRKTLEFADGSKIEWNVPGDQFNSIFMGTIVHQVTNKIEYHYKAHNIYAFIDIGSVKKKPQDQFVGEIHWNGKKLIDISGNYMGYIDIGGVRYMDLREMDKFYFPIQSVDPAIQLESDSLKRPDSVNLKRGDVKEAQKRKDQLEVEQRHDRKLRETCEARRKKKGGKKFGNLY